MTEIGTFILMMSILTLSGGLWIGMAVEKLQKRQYARFGWSVMLALSMILFMIQLIFSP